MSFLTIEDGMIRDFWPQSCGRPVDDTSYSSELPEWQLIPVTFDGICDSVEVINAGEDSSGALRHRLVYRNKPSEDEDEDALYEVCLRIQGIIHSSKIGPLGDWNGTPSNCPKASHKLVLEGSLDEETFALQTNAIDQIKNYIFKTLRSKPPKSSAAYGGCDTLVLQRRVFTRVRPTHAVRTALTRGDDPDGLAKKVEKQWIVDHRIGYSLQTEHGARRVCNHIAIRTGDFVDVGVVFDIFTRFIKGKKTTVIELAVKDVLRLRNGQEIETIKHQMKVDGQPFKQIVATSSGLQVMV